MQITLNELNYQVGKLDALKQFHVARRLAPILASLGVNLNQLKSLDSKLGGEGAGDAFIQLLGPITEAIGKMTDEDSNYIIFTCLSVVRRESPGGGFAPISTATQQLMYQDIDMVVMLRLAVEVVRENLRGFFPELGDKKNSPSS